MIKTKEIFITGFALFSMFFGAGNLMLPPYLGFKSGNDWGLVFLGFAITAVIVPILGIVAHANLQGTMFDFGKKVHPVFSWVYCFIAYTISIFLPVPRTASFTYEMSVLPYFNVSSLATSIIYFSLVFIVVLNRSKVVELIGKFITPLIFIILAVIIVLSAFTVPKEMFDYNLKDPLVNGILEGYQTFDALGSVVVGGVIIVSLKLNRQTSFLVKKEIIKKAGFVAGIGLLLIYGGLIFSGAKYSNIFSSELSRTEVLSGLSTFTLGNLGTSFLSVLVALACFTTAVGVIIGTADFIKGIFKDSKKIYVTVAFLSCVIGILIGQFNVHYIIQIALPVLMFIYPITIVLIVLNLFPEKLASKRVFKWVVLITFLFSIPDFLSFFIPKENFYFFTRIVPFSNENLGWVLPAIVTFLIGNILKKN